MSMAVFKEMLSLPIILELSGRSLEEWHITGAHAPTIRSMKAMPQVL